MLSIWIWTEVIFCYLMNVWNASFTASDSNFIICYFLFGHVRILVMHCNTAPQPVIKPSVCSKTCGGWFRRDTPLQISKFSVHYKSPCFEFLFRTRFARYDPCSFRAWICCCLREWKLNLAGATAWTVKVKWLRTCVNSKMDISWL